MIIENTHTNNSDKFEVVADYEKILATFDSEQSAIESIEAGNHVGYGVLHVVAPGDTIAGKMWQPEHVERGPVGDVFGFGLDDE